MGAEQLNKFSMFTITRGALYPKGDWLGKHTFTALYILYARRFWEVPGGTAPLPAPGYAISEYLDLLCYFRGIAYVE